MESYLAISDDSSVFNFQEKSHWIPRAIEGKNVYITVPQTDTGGQVEKTKTIGRRMIKELGKKTGRNLWEMPCLA